MLTEVISQWHIPYKARERAVRLFPHSTLGPLSMIS